jgi:hypothetical protein
MRRALVGGAVSILVGASLVAVAGPVAAVSPAPVPQQSWAWANDRQPLISHVPAAIDRGNLLGAGAASITRNGIGDYTVTFPSAALAGETGVAHVIALGAANRVCVTTGTTLVVNDVEVDVLCTGPGPIPLDSEFSVTYLAMTGGLAPFGYLTATHPGPASYIVPAADSYNSTGGAARVRILGVGQYRVRLDGLGTTDGDIQVTPLTDGRPRYCEVDSWVANAGNLVADLRCYKPSGVLADTKFTFSWNKNVGLKGDGGTAVGYARANQPGAGIGATYIPAAATRYNSTGTNITVVRVALGEYVVTFKNQPVGGAAAVTPFGAAGNRCFAKAIKTSGSPAKVRVGCVNGAGGRANTEFMVSWLK